MSTSEPVMVVLTSGLSVPVDALRLAWQLEDRGLHIRFDGEDVCIGPKALLTDSDRAAIRQHRNALKAVVTYVDQLVM
jgi:hypothetical protein